jgi:hypothetical protein
VLTLTPEQRSNMARLVIPMTASNTYAADGSLCNPLRRPLGDSDARCILSAFPKIDPASLTDDDYGMLARLAWAWAMTGRADVVEAIHTLALR